MAKLRVLKSNDACIPVSVPPYFALTTVEVQIVETANSAVKMFLNLAISILGANVKLQLLL